MKRTIDEHASRFDAKAAEYDDGDDREVYQRCLDQVIAAAAPNADDIVLDLGTGTGAIPLALAEDADRVIGRDISEEMLAQARDKAAAAGVDNVSFEEGRFREPRYDGPVDIVTSNYALHHLDDDGKREAIRTIASLKPRKFVLGDLMFFEAPDPDHPDYDPDVDDPARVGTLAVALTQAGFAVTAIHRISSHVGVIVATGPPEE